MLQGRPAHTQGTKGEERDLCHAGLGSDLGQWFLPTRGHAALQGHMSASADALCCHSQGVGWGLLAPRSRGAAKHPVIHRAAARQRASSLQQHGTGQEEAAAGLVPSSTVATLATTVEDSLEIHV